MSERPLLSSREAARWLGISERGLHRLKQSGALPFVRVGRGAIRYRAEALARWAETQERTETPASDGR